MILVRQVVLCLLLICTAVATAQNALPTVASRASREENLSIRMQRVPGVLHGRIDGLSIIEGKLCLRVDGVFYSSHIEHYTVRSLDVDPMLNYIDEKATYITCHPASGQLLFTRRNRSGRTALYSCVTNGKRTRAQEVKLDGFNFDIQHPTFTADGNTMVFASDCPMGSEGGLDLWYSIWKGEGWSIPRPLGTTVNSSATDQAPFICGDYLYFCSNRGQQDSMNFDFYACRLVSSDSVHGDTVFSNPIGKGKVQRVIAPLCSNDAECELVLDEKHNCGFWLVHPLDGTEDRLYSFEGTLTSVRLSGVVNYGYSEANLPENFTFPTARSGPLAQCDIAVYDARQPHGTPLFTAHSDDQGRYNIYLQPGYSYRIVFHKDGFRKVEVDYAAWHSGKDEFCVTGKLNDTDAIRLDGYYPNVDYSFSNEWYGTRLFEPAEVGTALGEVGREQLREIAQFLIDNPDTYVYVTTIFTKGSPDFNKLVTMARQDAIEQFFFRQGVPAKVLNNAKYESVIQGEPEDALGNATHFSFSTQPFIGGYDEASWHDNKNSLHHFLEGTDEGLTQRVQMWTPDVMKKNNEAKTDTAAANTQNTASENKVPSSQADTPAIDPSFPQGETSEEEEPSQPSESFRKMLESEVYIQE